jgi:FkbM family methyltransferase
MNTSFIWSCLRFLKDPSRHTERKRLSRIGIDFKTYAQYDLPWLRLLDFDTILDIGAARGGHSLVYHEMFPQATIHAFEPIPENYNKLVTNVSGIPNIFTYNLALGSENESKSLHMSPYLDASSFLNMADLHKTAYPGSDFSGSKDVEVRTLDEMIQLSGNEKVLIKMDTQGYEGKIIEGGRKLFAKAQVVIMEVCFRPLYEGAPTFDDLYLKMTSLGYEFRGNLDQALEIHDKSILQGDCIFLRANRMIPSIN